MRADILKQLRHHEALPAALLLSGSLLFYLPLSVAVDNTVFFVFSAAQLALGLALAWVLLAAALVGIAALVPPRARHIWAALLAGAGVFAWLQGWILTREYWELHWWLPPRGRIAVFSIDTLGAVVLFVAASAIYLRWRDEAARFLWLLNAGLALWTCALVAAAPGKPLDLERPRDLARFSAERNIVVLLLDAFQGDLFAEIMDREPQLRPVFEGFVYYRDAAGVASSTHLSIPTIHSGRLYADDASIRQFYRETVAEGSFMAHLAQAGYRGTYVNPMMDTCPRGLAWCGHEATVHDGLAPVYGREARLLADVAVRRTLPGFLRDYFYEGAAFDPDIHGRIERGGKLLDAVTANVVVDRGPPRVKFIHLMSTHAPVKVNQDCEPRVGRHWVRDDMRRQATCAVKRVARFMTALKKHGIYDQTTVVVLADHGSGLPPRAPTGDSWTPKFQLLNGMADVLLLVKPAQSRGPLQESWRPVDLRDVSATICAESGACAVAAGAEPLVGGGSADTARERAFMFYPWWFGKWTKDRLTVPERYRIVGPRTQRTAWRPLNNNGVDREL